jgi:cation:H+ antiporter
MLQTVTLLLASAAVIYFSCEGFVNGVEWLGRRLKLAESATGTVLAAFGTALPESVVTLVAAGFGHTPAQKAIGVGAALGGPLALSTVAYAVVAGALLLNARRLGRAADPFVQVESRGLRRDQHWFLLIFVFKIALGLMAFAWKPWLGFVFLAAYAAYVWKELRAREEPGEAEALAPLFIRPREAEPALGWAIAQTLLALVVIFAASHFFVTQIERLGPLLGLAPQLTALLFSPVATELPEIMNAVIWVRQGKERLALANISGAMMIQATVPTAFGLFWTPWIFTSPLLIAAVVTALAVIYLQWIFRKEQVSARELIRVALLYGVFAATIAV